LPQADEMLRSVALLTPAAQATFDASTLSPSQPESFSRAANGSQMYIA
jgi:hypothetical protein